MQTIHGVELFRAGYYSKHGRRYTSDDLAKMVDGVDSVFIGIEFVPSILDGKIGKAFNFVVIGDMICADVEIPDWTSPVHLNEYSSDHLAISCDLTTMKINGVSIVAKKLFPDAYVEADEPIIVHSPRK